MPPIKFETEEIPAESEEEYRICVKCGMPIEDKGTKYCAACRTTNSHKKGSAAKVTVVPPAALQKKANGVVTKLLIVGTILLASQRLNRIGIDDDRLESELALTVEEASAIAAPITRVTAKTAIGSKIIQPLAENEDLLEAGVAMFEYYRRTTKAINSLKQAQTQPVHRSNGHVPAGTSQASRQQRFPTIGNPSHLI